MLIRKVLDMTLMEPVRDKGYALIDNFGRVMETADLSRVLFHVPVWKHIYHALYWFDYWFAGPQSFLGAPFHAEGLESIDTPCEFTVTKEQLHEYYEAVAEKSRRYLDMLTDDMLTELAQGSDTNRLSCILGQFRHGYAHIGNINCVTIMDTDQWPFVAGKAADVSHGLYE